MSPQALPPKRKRLRSSRLRTVVILGVSVWLSTALACYNIRMSKSLMELEEKIRNCVRYKNESSYSAEAQRVWESYGQEVGLQTPIPDDLQNRQDERAMDTAEIPNGLMPPINWSMKLPNRNIDIGVPVSGQDSNLVEFFKVLGDSIGDFYRFTESSQQQVTIRVIVTRYEQDDYSGAFRQRLAEEAALPLDQVLFVTSSEPKFHRAYAINMLHNITRQDEWSVLAIVDVDMDLGPRFIFKSLAVVGKSQFYFPIVFSDYRPSNTMLVEQYLGPQHKYSEHRGLWRIFGYGMYAISGADASKYKLDESFQGWGGEDTEFFKRIKSGPDIEVVREKEYDLVHRWHAKNCALGGFVEPDKLRTCVKSRNAMEGSTFGQFLMQLHSSENPIYRKFLASSQWLSKLVALVMESKLYEGMVAKPQSKRRAYLEVIQALASHNGGQSQDGLQPGNLYAALSKDEGAKKILIGVTASRQTFATRVAEAVQTWAKELPVGVHVRFFVGELTNASVSYETGSPDDIANLAREAGIVDNSTIVVMKGIPDDEYPLVKKAAGVLGHMKEAMKSIQRQSEQNGIRWYFDVDDDTYVNIHALQEFIGKRNWKKHNYLGKRGTGMAKDREMLREGGLVKPYCLGGTGILMSKRTFDVLVDNMWDCIADANKTQTIVYDDVVFGMCLQRLVGGGCWDFDGDTPYDSGVFVQNFHGSDRFPRAWNLRKTISLHPHKTPGMMMRTHERFERHVYTAGEWPTWSAFTRFVFG